MIAEYHWTNDVCGCEFSFSWDEDHPSLKGLTMDIPGFQEVPKNLHNLIMIKATRICSAHSKHAHDHVKNRDVNLEENQRRMKAWGAIQVHTPEANFKDFKHSFDENRVLHVSHPVLKINPQILDGIEKVNIKD